MKRIKIFFQVIGILTTIIFTLLSIRYCCMKFFDSNDYQIDIGRRGTGTLGVKLTDVTKAQEAIDLFQEMNQDEISDYSVEIKINKYEEVTYSYKAEVKFFQIRRSMRNECQWYLDSLKEWLKLSEVVKEQEK